MNSTAKSIVFESVAPEIPVPAPFMKRRQEPEEGILIISLPREENNELAIRVLNRMAALVYLLCDGVRSIGVIVAEIKSLFPGADSERIGEDVIRTVRDLQRQGLLKVPRLMEP